MSRTAVHFRPRQWSVSWAGFGTEIPVHEFLMCDVTYPQSRLT
jgi:hypothetical protein